MLTVLSISNNVLAIAVAVSTCIYSLHLFKLDQGGGGRCCWVTKPEIWRWPRGIAPLGQLKAFEI